MGSQIGPQTPSLGLWRGCGLPGRFTRTTGLRARARINRVIKVGCAVLGRGVQEGSQALDTPSRRPPIDPRIGPQIPRVPIPRSLGTSLQGI